MLTFVLVSGERLDDGPHKLDNPLPLGNGSRQEGQVSKVGPDPPYDLDDHEMFAIHACESC